MSSLFFKGTELLSRAVCFNLGLFDFSAGLRSENASGTLHEEALNVRVSHYGAVNFHHLLTMMSAIVYTTY